MVMTCVWIIRHVSVPEGKPSILTLLTNNILDVSLTLHHELTTY